MEIKTRKFFMIKLKKILSEEMIKNIFNDLGRQIELTWLLDIQKT